MSSVNDVCTCGHKRKFHDVVIRATKNKYGANALYPYCDRYNHKCKICKCEKFTTQTQDSRKFKGENK